MTTSRSKLWIPADLGDDLWVPPTPPQPETRGELWLPIPQDDQLERQPEEQAKPASRSCTLDLNTGEWTD